MHPRELPGRYPLLGVLDATRIEAWLALAELLEAGLGETLFQAGTPGQHAYLVQEGRVRVVRTSETQGEISLGVHRAGELFGEYALLPPGKNTATCRTAAPTRSWRLPLAPLRQAIDAQPSVQRQLKRWLRLHVLLGHLREQAFLGFMSAAQLAGLLERFETVSFPDGQTIVA